MARPPRIELAGAVYHVTVRGADGRAVFVDEADRRTLLDLLGQTMQRFDAQVLAYNLLDEHFHLLLFTRQANLSRLMRHLDGVYTQYFNRRHGDGGPLFQGRFKAIVVDREALLLDVCRYVELNALRLGLVRDVADWPWSSAPAHIGRVEAPPWLDVDGLLGFVLGRPVEGAADRRRAAERYARLLASEPRLALWPGRLRQQIFLGDAAFVARVQALARAKPAAKGARRKPIAWSDWLRSSSSREQALYRAHTEGALSMTALAATLGLSVSRVSRLIAGFERAQSGAAH